MDHDSSRGTERFGTYLKSLRQDRRLTLERIEALTRDWPAPVTKSWLSRCEHAQTEAELGRLESLARIYRIRLGELAERFEIEQALARGAGPELAGADTGAVPLPGAGDDGEEADADTARTLLLLDAARRAEGLVPAASELPPGGPPGTSAAESAVSSPLQGQAPASRIEPSEARPAADARSRLCLAVLSGSTGNYRVCREEAEALFAAPDLPDDIRLRAGVQLAFAWRKLRRGPLARLLLGDLLNRGESLPPRIQADAHLLLGGLDLDEAQARPALLHLRKASALYRQHGSAGELARALQELGEAYRLSGRLAEAMLRYQEGWGIARPTGLRPLVADLESHLGRGHFLLGQHATAARFLRESNEAARRTDAWDIVFRNAWYLRALAERAGDEFARRTCERTLRQLLERVNPFAEESLAYRREVACKEERRREPCGAARRRLSSHTRGRGAPNATRHETGGGDVSLPAEVPGAEERSGTHPPVAPPPRYRSLGAPRGGAGEGAEVVPLSRNRSPGDRIVRGLGGPE